MVGQKGKEKGYVLPKYGDSCSCWGAIVLQLLVCLQKNAAVNTEAQQWGYGWRISALTSLSIDWAPASVPIGQTQQETEGKEPG